MRNSARNSCAILRRLLRHLDRYELCARYRANPRLRRPPPLVINERRRAEDQLRKASRERGTPRRRTHSPDLHKHKSVSYTHLTLPTTPYV